MDPGIIMTPYDISSDPVTDCAAQDGAIALPGSDDVPIVQINLRIDSSKWAAAVASEADAAALVAFIEAVRV